MPLLKRKPVLMHPLPSLSSIVQPVHAQGTSEASPSAGGSSAPAEDFLQDSKDDDEQLDKLMTALHDPTLSAPMPKKAPRGSLQAQAAAAQVNGTPNGTHAGTPGSAVSGYRVKNVDCFYIPETGEVFLDYESYAARRAFYDQPLFQCEVSGKSQLSYFKALLNEQREVKQLHARFPRQLKKAVLQSVNFQIEGKLETLADKVFERFHDRFFDDEKIFVDVQGDKYLARVVKTFPPKDLKPPPGASTSHPYATDLSMDNDEVIERDDPMKYFYQVRLIEEETSDDEEGSNAEGDDEGSDADKGERFESSVMEVQADKISRDRINFSRAMLKRFIRDCVSRDAAVFSPWIVKKPIGVRYGLPTEMTDEVRAEMASRREEQINRRKRDRNERLGITSDHEDEDNAPSKKKRLTKAERQKLKEEEAQAKEAEKEEEVKKKTRGTKYPIEDLLMEYHQERDGGAGRIEVRPVPNKDLPFGEHFEKFLMTWSFLNVMGKPLGLSAFTIDDFEKSLYHTDPYTSPVPLLVEIHAALLNALIGDIQAGHDPVRPIVHTGLEIENDTDYWEGTKGATAETLRPVVEPMANSWSKRQLAFRDNRRGWEQALVGCLWDRATLESMPRYLDHVLHLTFENKPAPTRPTWSTGPSSNGNATGLIPSKPDKRYASLHFVHKLDIINFLIELVAQTAVVRDFMEDATQALTEARKDQIEARREQRRLRAEREAIEPKDEDGDEVKDEPSESRMASPNGHANGSVAPAERDELDESMMGDGDETGSRLSSPSNDGRRAKAGASRRRAMRERAAEREAEEAMRAAVAAKEREEMKAARQEAKALATERKRLEDEEAEIDKKLHEIERAWRTHLFALRARPLGVDRYHNRVWWMDGLGSAPPMTGDNKIVWGTGRLYLQGAEDFENDASRQAVDMTLARFNERRDKEENAAGGGRLKPGEWAFYDTPEQLLGFYNWLNPRGTRDLHLQRQLKTWWSELEGGFHRRRIQHGIESVPEPDEPVRRVRPTRRAAGGDDETEGYLGWRNKRATGKE